MNAALTGRMALAMSTIGLVLAGIALVFALDEPRAAVGASPERSTEVEALSRRNLALATEIETLRVELASLRDSIGLRGATSEGRRIVPEAGMTKAAGSAGAAPGMRANEGTSEFLLRRELLDGFDGLGSGDRKDALRELAHLARWGDEEALKLIVESLDNESGAVRARALKELADLDEANFPDYLRRAFSDPSGSVREVVASRLDELPKEEAGPMLVELLLDSDEDVVLEAIKSIDDLEYTEARPFLAEQLLAEDLDVATGAAYALMKLGDAGAAAGTIQRILHDFAQGDVSDRIKDVKRLRQLRAVGQLERILDSDPSLAVRDGAREALVKLED